MNILIIDDSQTARLFTKKSLLMTIPEFKTEASFFEAENGEIGIKLLQNVKMDLILSDVNMPVMSGFTFIRNVLRDEKLQNIPIIFITSLANDARKQNLIDLGAKDVVAKPIKAMELANLVRKTLNLMPKEKSQNSDNKNSDGWG